MRTSFLGAEISFTAKLRDDAEDCYHGADLVIEISMTSDAPFVQKTEIWCIDEKDIDGMIAELQNCKKQVNRWQKAADKLQNAKKALRKQ